MADSEILISIFAKLFRRNVFIISVIFESILLLTVTLHFSEHFTFSFVANSVVFQFIIAFVLYIFDFYSCAREGRWTSKSCIYNATRLSFWQNNNRQSTVSLHKPLWAGTLTHSHKQTFALVHTHTHTAKRTKRGVPVCISYICINMQFIESIARAYESSKASLSCSLPIECDSNRNATDWLSQRHHHQHQNEKAHIYVMHSFILHCTDWIGASRKRDVLT